MCQPSHLHSQNNPNNYKLKEMNLNNRILFDQNRYKESIIKCDFKRPTHENILEALYVLTYSNPGNLKSPRGFHIRTRFTDSMTLSQYSAHINNFYKAKSGYCPTRITVCENDETGVHHHHAIVIDDTKDRIYSLRHLHAKLKKLGKLADYSIIAPRHDRYGHSLATLSDKDSYFKWMTYLAKSRSKPDKHQMWSGSRALTSALANWRKGGKPRLLPPDLEQRSRNTLPCDLSSFIS